MSSTLRPIAARLLLLGLLPFAASCSDDDGDGTTPTLPGDIAVTVTADGAARSGVTINLYAPGGTTAVDTRTTGADGVATFPDLEPGAREVEIVVPAGFELVDGETDRTSVTVASQQTATTSFTLVTTIAGEVVEVLLTDDLAFTPDEITIAPGTTVRWRSVSSLFHTVTPDGHSEWASASFDNAGDTFVHTFDTEGTFDYFCEPHVADGMVGTVIVEQ